MGLPCGVSAGVETASRLLSFFEHAPQTITTAASHRNRNAVARRPSSLVRLTRLTLIARDLTKEYRSGEHRLVVLRDVTFTIPQGAFVAIVGPSGSGKTTLLGLLAGLDTATRGQVLFDGADLTAMDEDQRARLRGEKVGFVFQSFQLISTLTALENVQVPLELRGEDGAAERARELLDRVGLGDRLDHFPTQLSGGEQQRVAIARAFANSPRVLFADEPTGNLDSDTGGRIVELLESLNRESGSTIVLVTHDSVLAQRAARTIRLADGSIIADTEAAA
jgi:putative ABC transport system ATP-binding protein